ncbi:lytic transglycosylase domain-containing protein [Clostridium saccharobutylicum]|uniref:Soluble lytic murein transglycosylase n=1 Tax=Clostridium saccharobutylicum DSM 13864 TaxID=1345695 RepID=U5MRW4_CLOSA|nr:lytic transglycosylase domain-containing protein [Clostridium saccharobutylicum]AGX42182.1 soluble lytic murein transglycosylase [Clostridium saccharobutylicum DSM 13864]AQR89461.1 soluble lytic murein transglycosylase precursor [Clostridium saccharobutylicum]AQR99363.1 soluble lytic murein transglycosylase precursor [Clostridium saccharobutylicum]AQS09094.1 soluble lytic murein transglycosylase precursor [Clostridium saccharobutylicum]AQS13349.1 soluble lytic murein transglycosylase precur
MKILRNIFCMLIVLLVIVACSRYVIEKKFFPYKYKEYVDTYSKEYGLDPMFVLAVIKTESKFDDDAHSHKNAVGLMQITAETGEWAAKEMGYSSFSKDDLYNEEYNIKMGCWYLKRLKEMFNGDLDLTIAAYNAGPTNVQNWLKNEQYSGDGKNIDYIPFGETKKYVDKVNTYYSVYKYLYGKDEGYFDTSKILNIIGSLWNVHFV